MWALGTVLSALLVFPSSAVPASPAPVFAENINGVVVTPVLKTPGHLYDDYDITVDFNVRRGAAPAVTIYFEVYLREQDIVWDNFFGPDLVCVAPAQWIPIAGGAVQAHITARFPSVSNFWGVDWTVTGADVTEKPCPEKAGKGGGWMDEQAPGDHIYRYLIENDPSGIAMNPSLTIVSAQVGPFSFPFSPPISNGSLRQVSANHPLPPAVAPNATVPYTLTFSNGSTLTGLTVGPGLNPVPSLPGWTLAALVVLTLVLGLVLTRRVAA